MDWGSNGEEPTSWEENYSVNLIPSELFFKFRKEVQGLRVGLNLEFYNAPINEFQGKIVLKPLAPERTWKFIYEPIHQDVRVLSKKIPLTGFLNLQVGIGHNFQMNAIGWKWKLTTCFGGDGISRTRSKTSVRLVPGVDLRFGWRADYVLPEITGALGTGEPWFNMNSGKLQASLDRVETIVTYTDIYSLYKPKGQDQQQRTETDVISYSSPSDPLKSSDFSSHNDRSTWINGPEDAADLHK
ncbi:unnamed protein product [Malus baccata var. baccata]